MRKDVLFDKYDNILIDIITNYNNTKIEKAEKINIIIYFFDSQKVITLLNRELYKL